MAHYNCFFFYAANTYARPRTQANCSAADGGKLVPVMFYVHGGGFEAGFSIDYQAQVLVNNFASRDVVYVFCEYRQGILGKFSFFYFFCFLLFLSIVIACRGFEAAKYNTFSQRFFVLFWGKSELLQNWKFSSVNNYCALHLVLH